LTTAAEYGERGRERATKLGIALDRLPPGQSPTLKFPVLQIWKPPKMADALWTLRVHGEVEAPFELDLAALKALPQTSLTTDLHCVTRWSKFDTTWTGVRVRDLIERARPTPAATHVMVHGHDGYTTNVPLPALLDDNVLITHTYEDAPLPREHGGPVRLLLPKLYLWKSAKWVSELELLDHDEPGIWERNGYHNDADPWKEQRREATRA
jgi:DMSO/TMAO reductase YedYZ molybdopterin-dependent catalytic subunit